MQIVKPEFEILAHTPQLTRLIERGGRVCYKSEDKIGEDTDIELIGKLMNFKHESVLEHGSITVRFVTDRGVTHELVRHRLCAFSQESTRYCNYGKGKHGEEIKVIQPFFFDVKEKSKAIVVPCVDLANNQLGLRSTQAVYNLNSFDIWFIACLWAQWGYMTLTKEFGRSAQEARSVLPNSLKTEIIVTANVREWRHILTLRTSREAHPQIRQIMVPLGWKLAEMWPCLFGEFKDKPHTAPAAEGRFSTTYV